MNRSTPGGSRNVVAGQSGAILDSCPLALSPVGSRNSSLVFDDDGILEVRTIRTLTVDSEDSVIWFSLQGVISRSLDRPDTNRFPEATNPFKTPTDGLADGVVVCWTIAVWGEVLALQRREVNPVPVTTNDISGYRR